MRDRAASPRQLLSILLSYCLLMLVETGSEGVSSIWGANATPRCRGPQLIPGMRPRRDSSQYWDSQYELAEAVFRKGDSVSRFDRAALNCCRSRRARKGRKMPETSPR